MFTFVYLFTFLFVVNAYDVDAADVELFTSDAQEEYALSDVEYDNSYEQDDMNEFDDNDDDDDNDDEVNNDNNDYEEDDDYEDDNEYELGDAEGDEFMDEELDSEIDEEMELLSVDDDELEDDDDEEEEDDDDYIDNEEEDIEYSLTDDFIEYYGNKYYVDPFSPFFDGIQGVAVPISY
ncbi:Uncharacterized protein QTN25_005444 [Entamoeba marina]